MTRQITYIISRVLIGLLIGAGMFYFRSAHALTCPTGQTSYRTISNVSETSSSAAIKSANPMLCTLGQVIYTGTAGSNCQRTAGGVIPGSTADGGAVLYYGPQTEPGCSTLMAGNCVQTGSTTPSGLKADGTSASSGRFSQAYSFGESCMATYVACTAGQVIGTGSTSGLGSIAGGVCSGGCKATAVLPGCVSVTIGSYTSEACGDATTQWTLTGASCPSTSPPANFNQANVCSGLFCTFAGAGQGSALKVDGTIINSAGLTTSNYTTTTSGGRVTSAGAGSPPKPDNGTPGAAVSATSVATAGTSTGGTTTSTVINYYNAAAVSGSSATGNGGTPTGTPSSGTKIDETGTPTTAPGHDLEGDRVDQAIATARSRIGEADGLVNQAEGAIKSRIPELGGVCQTLTIGSVKGTAVLFPGAKGCAMLTGIKEFLAYLLGILTVYYIYRRFLDTLGGNGATAS